MLRRPLLPRPANSCPDAAAGMLQAVDHVLLMVVAIFMVGRNTYAVETALCNHAAVDSSRRGRTEDT